jgi:cytochrome c oxidase subunit 4
MPSAVATVHNRKPYWTTWWILLSLTVIMLVVDSLEMPRGVFLTILLSAMLVKASLIGAYFMHLRFERVSLTLMVIVGLFINGAILFGLIVPDAVRIRGMMP